MKTPPTLKQETLDLLEKLMNTYGRDPGGIRLDQPDYTNLSPITYTREDIEDSLVVMLDYQTQIPEWFDDRVEHLGNSSVRNGISVWRLRDPKDLTELALTTPLLSKSILLD